MAEPAPDTLGVAVDVVPIKKSGDEESLHYMKVMKPYAQRQCACFACACGCHCFLFFLFLVLNVTVGKKFMNQSTEVALHLWDNKWKVRDDAIIEGDKICKYDLLASSEQRQQEMSRIPVGLKEYELEVVYKASDGNVLDVKKLKKIKELEDYIVGKTDYPKFCLRAPNTSTCMPPLSVVRACDPALCGYEQLREGKVSPQAGCGVFSGGKTPAVNCDPVKSYVSGVFQCTKQGGCDRTEWTIESAFLEKKVADYSSASYPEDKPESDFLLAVDSQFAAGSTTASAVRAKFKFGFPLEGFSSTSDRAKDQVKELEDFMSDEYFEKLNNYNSDAGDDAGFLIGFTGGPLTDMSIQALLMGDFLKVGFAFVIVFAYVVFMTESYFYAFMAMGQIFLGFTTGFIFYRVIYGSFFGSFHIMAIFLLLGVGVDDVFVFLDTFEGALQVDARYGKDLWGRLSWTWHHAATAMGVTSLTTAVSFFMNATSSFPGIAAFGIFAGALVVVMYISMCFFWPACICLNELKFKQVPFCCGAVSYLEKCAKSKQAAPAKSVANPEEEISKPALVRFFEDHFSYFILHHRCKIVLVFIAVSVYMFIQVASLKPEKEAPEFLPEDHPVEQYGQIMKGHFVRGGGVFNTKVNLAFGFDRDPLDKDGTDPTGQGNGEDIDDIGILGKVRWNPNFVDAEGRMNLKVILGGGFDCMVQLCNSAEAKNSERKTGGTGYRMKGCFARDVKMHMNQTDENWQAKWDKITKDLDTAAWAEALNEKIKATPGWEQETLQYTYGEKVGEEVIWRFFRTEMTLTSDINMDYADGNEIAAAWENWMSYEMSIGACAATADTFWGFVSAKDFHQFKVSENLVTEMMTGILVSISVALVVLIAVTGNIIVGFCAALTIGLIVSWVMAMIPIMGWELGMVECIVLVMVPGLSVDFTAHLAEAYSQAKYDDREHRVVHSLEHSGVSIVSGAVSTCLAGLCLTFCDIVFFVKFGTLILCTIIYAVLFSLFFFPAVMAIIGPKGTQGDWHKCIHPKLQREFIGHKKLRTSIPLLGGSVNK